MNKKLKYLFIGILVIALIISVFVMTKGNKKEETDTSKLSCYDLAFAMAYAEPKNKDLVVCNYANEEYKDMIMLRYGIENTDDGCLIYSGNEEPTEFAVFRIKRGNEYTTTDKIKALLEAYIQQRIGVYTGYYPEAVEILDIAQVAVEGEYVILNISKNVVDTYKAFEVEKTLTTADLLKKKDMYSDYALILENNRQNMLSGKKPGEEDTSDLSSEEASTQEEPSSSSSEEPSSQDESATDEDGHPLLLDVDDSVYYNKDIVTAYLEDKPELLTDEKDIEIYNNVKRVIEENITDSMTTVEKEKAIHDYMCDNMEYDKVHFDINSPFSVDADNPYGAFAYGYGICTGYASTFKIFMDCLGIECIVVEGMAYEYTDNHAWNKVKLGATWYNVDVTWDDPILSGDFTNVEIDRDYSFFNCSDEDMELTQHNWNKSQYPESKETMSLNMD